jgi:hypothetical protein
MQTSIQTLRCWPAAGNLGKNESSTRSKKAGHADFQIRNAGQLQAL